MDVVRSDQSAEERCGILGGMQLEGKRVLVTGASRGIGAALALEFAEAGARLALVARESERLRDVTQRLGASSYAADLTDPDQVHGLISRIEADGGPVDVLVNNAGVETAGEFLSQDWADIESLYRLNLLTPVELCHQVLPGMLDRQSGHLVNMSSLAGVTAFPGLAAYSSSKAGLTHFTAGLRADLRGRPVKTTVVELGPVATDLLDRAKSYRPVDDSFARAYQLHVLTEIDAEVVAQEVVAAVRRDHRHVRLPKRAGLAASVAEAPRRATEWLLTGVDHQSQP